MRDEHLRRAKLVKIFMITLPDFKQKQILFIQTQRNVSNKIRFQNDNIVFLKDDKVANRASCHRVFAAFIIGDISLTSELIKQARRLGVSFFLLKYNFEPYAAINAASEGNYLLRMRQYELEDDKELFIARQIVKNKVANQISLLKSREIGENIVAREKEIMEAIDSAGKQDSLRGIEGNVSKEFFKEYFGPIGWSWRMPRVKPDIPNFLLDIGYTMMFNTLDALLCLYGFDTYKGCYHKLFFQRKSLTCDIVEPFRAIIDREVLKLYTLKKIQEKDFKQRNGNLLLSFEHSAKYAQVFLEAIMNHKEEMYRYVQGYYRFFMNSEANPFPHFKISR